MGKLSDITIRNGDQVRAGMSVLMSPETVHMSPPSEIECVERRY